VGYANAGMFEVYLIAVEPGVGHTFLESCSDYLHFVSHAPQKGAELKGGDKALVARARLGHIAQAFPAPNGMAVRKRT